MIVVTVTPIAGSRTNTGISLQATATVDGVEYTARSRHGSPNQLAREMVATGIPDPIRWARRPRPIPLAARVAGYTYTEGNGPLHRVCCVEQPGFWPAPLRLAGQEIGERMPTCHWSASRKASLYGRQK